MLQLLCWLQLRQPLLLTLWLMLLRMLLVLPEAVALPLLLPVPPQTVLQKPLLLVEVVQQQHLQPWPSQVIRRSTPSVQHRKLKLSNSRILHATR